MRICIEKTEGTHQHGGDFGGVITNYRRSVVVTLTYRPDSDLLSLWSIAGNMLSGYFKAHSWIANKEDEEALSARIVTECKGDTSGAEKDQLAQVAEASLRRQLDDAIRKTRKFVSDHRCLVSHIMILTRKVLGLEAKLRKHELCKGYRPHNTKCHRKRGKFNIRAVL